MSTPFPSPTVAADNAMAAAESALPPPEPALPSVTQSDARPTSPGPEGAPAPQAGPPDETPGELPQAAEGDPARLTTEPTASTTAQTASVAREDPSLGPGVLMGDPVAPFQFSFGLRNWGQQGDEYTPTKPSGRAYPVTMLAGCRRPNKRRRSSRSPSAERAGPSTEGRMPPPPVPRVPSGEAADLFQQPSANQSSNLFAFAPHPRPDRDVIGVASWQPDFAENFGGVASFANLDGRQHPGPAAIPFTPVLAPIDGVGHNADVDPIPQVAFQLPPPVLHDEGEAPPLPDHVDITFEDPDPSNFAEAHAHGGVRRGRPATPYPPPGQGFRPPRGPVRQDVAPTMAGPIPPPPHQLAQPTHWPGHQALGATPPPLNGFPEVHFGDPYGVYRGLTDDRSHYIRLQDPETSVVVTVWNYSANYNPRTGPSQTPPPPPIHVVIPILADAISGMIGGEDGFVIVPPEAPLNTVTTPHSAPFAWGVLELTAPSARTLRAIRVVSLPQITFFVHSNVPTITRYLFSARGFSHNRNNDIALTVQRVFLGRDVLSRFWALMQNNPEYSGLTSGQALRRIIGTLRVRVLTLENGPILAGIYSDPPTNSPDRWLALIGQMAQTLFTSNRNTTGFVARAMRCLGCHGTDHPTHLCQYPELQGWNGRPAGQHVLPPYGGAGGAPPPPPPPPPGMPGPSNRPARRGQYNEHEEFDHYYDYQPQRGGGGGKRGGGRGGRGGGGGNNNGYNGNGYGGFRRGG